MEPNKFSLKFNVILLAVIFGLFAGIAGELIMRFYVFKDLYQVPYGNEVNLTGATSRSGMIINNAQKVVVNQDVMVQNTINSANASFVGLFKKQTPNKNAAGFNRADYYDLTQPALSALVLTSDGWLMANVPANYSLPDFIDGYVAISQAKKVYKINQIIDARANNLLFIHLADTRDLSAKNLAGTNEAAAGQLAVAVNWQNDALLTEITSVKNKNKLIKSSDKVNQELVLANTLSDNFKNTWVFDLGGNLIGLINEQKTVKSVVNFRSLILNILKNRELSTPYLGINYLDLSQTVKNDPNQYGSTLRQSGAIIYPDDTKVAVYKNSPAAAAGLQADDIIISVNNTNLDENNDLADIVQNSLIGDTLSIKYMRGSDVKTVDIVLAEKK